MIYSYRCHKCNTLHDVFQSMRDIHVYTCHICGEKCVRVYQKPHVRKNQGFWSWTLGEWVDSHDDFENKLQKVRYVSGEGERLGDNKKPKDEWVENRLKKETRKKEMLKQVQEQTDMVYHNAQKG